jgi:hypothetical protein
VAVFSLLWFVYYDTLLEPVKCIVLVARLFCTYRLVVRVVCKPL